MCRVLGAALLAFGLILTLIAVRLIINMRDAFDYQTVLPFAAGCFLVGQGGRQLWLAGKQLHAPTVLELIERDPRPPVLYLRAFHQDDLSRRAVGFWHLDVFVSTVLHGGSTEEEQLTRALDRAGPCIAIGRPGEKHRPLGAARIYTSSADIDWQVLVQDEMPTAALVVLTLGATPGVWWELEVAIERVRPERLLLLIPNVGDAYERFARWATGRLPVAVPPLGQERQRILTTTLRGALWFESDWTPRLVSFGTEGSRSRYMGKRGMFRAFASALMPVFDRVARETDASPAASGARQQLAATTQPEADRMRFRTASRLFVLAAVGTAVGIVLFGRSQVSVNPSLEVGDCVRRAGRNLEPVACDSLLRLGRVLVIDKHVEAGFEQPDCPDETDFFQWFDVWASLSLYACIGNPDLARTAETVRPADPGEGHGIVRAGDCVGAAFAVRSAPEVPCASGDVYAMVTARTDGLHLCPSSTVEAVEIASDRLRIACLGEGPGILRAGDRASPTASAKVPCQPGRTVAVEARVPQASDCPPSTTPIDVQRRQVRLLGTIHALPMFRVLCVHRR